MSLACFVSTSAREESLLVVTHHIPASIWISGTSQWNLPVPWECDRRQCPCRLPQLRLRIHLGPCGKIGEFRSNSLLLPSAQGIKQGRGCTSWNTACFCNCIHSPTTESSNTITMDFVYKFRDSVVGYISPAAKRRRTTGPVTPTRDEEPTFDAPTSEPQGSKAQAVVITRISKKYISNSRKRAYQEDEEDTTVTISPEDSVSQIGAADESEVEQDESDNEEEDAEEDGGITGEGEESNSEGHDSVVVSEEDSEDHEADQYPESDNEEDIDVDDVGSSEEELTADLESSNIIDEDDANVDELGSDEEGVEADLENSSNENEDEFQQDDLIIFEENPDVDEAEISARAAAAAEARVQEYIARQAELALRREDIEKAKAIGDWHPDAMILFERLALRSFEEVLPDSFKIDFPTLPEDIFAPSGTDTFINNNCLTALNGVKALQGLLRLGGRARERLEAIGSAEKLIAKGIHEYIKWSERDGGFDKLRFLPVLVVVAARPNQSTERISVAIEQQMTFLAKRHREYLALPTAHTNELGEVEKYRRQPPLLYGVIVAQTMVIFVTMDSANPELKVKHLFHFDFKDKSMDVWNGFAISFVVIMARNYVMGVKDDLEEESEESDPDL